MSGVGGDMIIRVAPMPNPDRSLSSLSTPFYDLACKAIAECAAQGVALMIIQTGRTPAEQHTALSTGHSTITLSKHLPRILRGFPETDPEIDKSDAIDLAPYDQYQLHGPDKLKWDNSDPAFEVLGKVAEKLGLRWGGRWNNPVDMGHIELVFPNDNIRLAIERARPWPKFNSTDA